jgi:UDP-2,3-diacylglucosamine pyrophosphatase LpxH
MSPKIPFISDFHFGIKKASDIFLDSQLDFIKNQFEPYLSENNIKEIFILGDLFDNRTHINIKIKNIILDIFENVLKKYKIYLLIGNHDCFFSDNIKINSLNFLNKFENVTLIDKNTVLNINDKKFYAVPWITNNNTFITDINNLKEKIDVCVGHFSINGFKLNKTKIEESGLSTDYFKKFKKVFSGHFHTRCIRKNNDCEIIYIGSPYQLNRGDMEEARGFCVLDTDTLEYEFIDNNRSIKYVKLVYPETFEEEIIKGNIIDVCVNFNDNFDELSFSNYFKKIDSFKPAAPPLIIPLDNFRGIDDDVELKSKTSSELLREYVDILKVDNKDIIYSELENIYEETKNVI